MGKWIKCPLTRKCLPGIIPFVGREDDFGCRFPKTNFLSHYGGCRMTSLTTIPADVTSYLSREQRESPEQGPDFWVTLALPTVLSTLLILQGTTWMLLADDLPTHTPMFLTVTVPISALLTLYYKYCLTVYVPLLHWNHCEGRIWAPLDHNCYL